MPRIALGLSYNGHRYQGWQSQVTGLTVQDKLEHALAQFTGKPVSTLSSGRTDAGVHALQQVVHFDTDVIRTPHAWSRGTNTHLPSDIAVHWAQEMPGDFHCRGSALSRRYAYVLLESEIRPSLESGRVGWSFRPLDGDAMRAAAARLIGEHDFTSFRASQCQALSPVKQIFSIGISQRGAYWRFDFEAKAYLHHMIRNIMGCLVYIGQQKKPVSWMQTVLEARNRQYAAPTFAADGLYFLGPQYDPHWGISQSTPLFDWLP